MPVTCRVALLATLASIIATLTACGSSSGTTTMPANPSPTAARGLDSCVVGTWKSANVHGTVTSADGSLHIPLNGGAGEVAVIGHDGSVALDYGAASPEQGAGTDGSTYSITVTGRVAGRLHAANGHATLDIADPNTATETITKDGVVIQTVHPPPEQVSIYTCHPRRALSVTSDGITTDWSPSA